jgi:putative NADH-flavin reductase
MQVLVVGANGATGQLLLEQLLHRGIDIKAIVRTPDTLSKDIRKHDRLALIQASILELNEMELVKHVQGCTAVASCLGHRLTLKGIYGRPRRLVTDATRRLCNAIKSSAAHGPTRFVLMNTAGNSNRDLNEPVSLAHRLVIGGIRCLVPPHADNEQAADYLRVNIGQDDNDIQWAAVRPDTLIDEDRVTEYALHPSPTRSAIFNPGKTSRINVAHFMADLITDDAIWERWRGKMPVIYNRVS